MKRVSFKVAKAIKEAGYLQGILNNAYYNEDGILVKSFVFNGGNEIADAPTYLEVWLWLWREKNIAIKPIDNFATYITGFEDEIELEGYKDPEEAIIAAIKYLVDNDLIK